MTSILVVDDDQTVRETLTDYFDTLGYVVRAAATATAGRQAAGLPDQLPQRQADRDLEDPRPVHVAADREEPPAAPAADTQL